MGANQNRELHEVMTACGTVLRGEFRGFRIESDSEKWVHIIDEKASCECCVIDAEGDVISCSGEFVTESWSQNDWADFTKFVGAKAGGENE